MEDYNMASHWCAQWIVDGWYADADYYLVSLSSVWA